MFDGPIACVYIEGAKAKSIVRISRVVGPGSLLGAPLQEEGGLESCGHMHLRVASGSTAGVSEPAILPSGSTAGVSEPATLPSIGSPRSSPAVAVTTPKSSASNCMIAPGLPAVKRWLLESILANECIDLTELPPAKGRSKIMPNSLEGKVLLMHETDFQQTKQLIPDINTWIQCFSVYTAIVVHYYPTSMLCTWPPWGNLARSSGGHPG